MADNGGSGRNVGEILAEFAQMMATDTTPEQVLERVGNYCTELLPIHGVGVLLKSANGGLEVATANTEAGEIVERLEADLAEGPCTDSLSSGEQVIVPDLAAAVDRYPRFAPKALDAGVKAIHGLPMAVRSETVGSLNVIALEPLELSATEIATAQMLADVAISYIANARAFTETSTLAQQLQYALDSRVVIEQAKGILSERRKISVSDAFETMRKYARNNHRKLHDVAAAIVRRELEI